jgi:chromosome segregation ATPase
MAQTMDPLDTEVDPPAGSSSETDRRRRRRLARLERELSRDMRRHRDLVHRYEDLRGELDGLNAAIQRRRRLIDVLRESIPGDPSRDTPPQISKPQIAERILSTSLEPMFPRQVRDAAVERGWLKDDAASRNQLGVAMSKMAQKGRLVRGGDGRYTMPGRDQSR